MTMLLFLLAAAAPAPAAMLSSHNPESVVSYLQSEGYRAKLIAPASTDDPSFGPRIETSDGGTTFGINFLNCKARKQCRDVLFTSSWAFETGKSPSPATIHKWNAERRFTKAYLDKEGDPVLEMDVLFQDGRLDPANFKAYFEVYTSGLQTFEEFIAPEEEQSAPAAISTSASH